MPLNPSGTEQPLVNKRKSTKSSSLGKLLETAGSMYSNEYQESQYVPYLSSVFSKTKSRTDLPLGNPINTGPTRNHYRETAASYPSATYSPSVYAQSYYPESVYDDDAYYGYEHKKNKKIAAAIAIPLALILGPLAFVGLLALYSIRTILVIQIIQSLCTNPGFASGYESLCTLINNIGKRSSAKEEIFNTITASETLSKIMSYLHNTTYTALDHLNSINELNNNAKSTTS